MATHDTDDEVTIRLRRTAQSSAQSETTLPPIESFFSDSFLISRATSETAAGPPHDVLRDHQPHGQPELRQAAPFKALFEALEIEQERRGNL